MTYLGWAVGLIGSIVGIWVTVSRYNLEHASDSSRIWRDEAEAEKARADRLESSLESLTARVGRLESENNFLRSMVTGERALADLAALVATQHAETMTALEALRAA
ncbi:hypothetical protein [Streptacidiphilus albus]|uniref:hypothetical protein n=1 Tax=Streptacidiphilus albus TaxID=105425 RepID=UPI00054B8C3D|nr:hypothetical protein [Streptacidiphilus albus]